MPYIGNITSDFSVDTGNITNRAVTATKLSPSSVGSNGQVLSVDGSGNLQWGNDANAPEGTAVLSTGESGTTKYLRVDGDGTCSWQLAVDATKTTLTGSTNNTITTVTGANAIQGEANLTFDGNKLSITPNKNSNNDGFEVIPADGTTASSFKILGNNNAGADGRNGCATFIDVNYYATTSTILNLKGRGSEILSVLGSGNVGIGDNAPTFKTEIKVSDTTAYSSTSMASSQTQLRINNAGLSGVAGILLTAEPSSGSAGYTSIRTISPSSGSGDLTFSTRNASNFGERVRIQHDGKVGIGTSSPSGKLTVHNTDDANVNVFEVYNDNGNISGSFSQNSTGDGTVGVRKNDGTLSVFFRSNGISYLNGGDVGIGTATPANLLSLESSAPVLSIKDTDSYSGYSNGGKIYFQGTDSDGNVKTFAGIKGVSQSSNNGQLRLQSRNSGTLYDRLTIMADGKIGLYTITSPVATLHQKSHSNGWEGGIILEEQNATTGWNIHPDNNDQLMIGRNTDTSTGSATHVASFSIDGIKLPSGKGINFSAYATALSGSGSPDPSSNLLDDYEEGMWTPETVTGTWGQVTGYYTKIGQQVFLTAYMYGCNTTSGSDLVKVDNLPFAPISGMTCGTVITEASTAFTVAYMNGGGFITLAQNDGGSSIHYMEHSDLSSSGSTGRLHINANYRTAA